MGYPKISAQVAIDFFSKVEGEFSFDILTRQYKVKIGNNEVTAATIYEVFMAGAELINKQINNSQVVEILTINQGEENEAV